MGQNEQLPRELFKVKIFQWKRVAKGHRESQGCCLCIMKKVTLKYKWRKFEQWIILCTSIGILFHVAFCSLWLQHIYVTTASKVLSSRIVDDFSDSILFLFDSIVIYLLTLVAFERSFLHFSTFLPIARI